MSAVYVSNLVINAGSTFSQTFELGNTQDNSPFNLTGYSIEAQMRKHKMNTLLSVAEGTTQPAKLITLQYHKGKQNKKMQKTKKGKKSKKSKRTK